MGALTASASALGRRIGVGNSARLAALAPGPIYRGQSPRAISILLTLSLLRFGGSRTANNLSPPHPVNGAAPY